MPGHGTKMIRTLVSISGKQHVLSINFKQVEGNQIRGKIELFIRSGEANGMIFLGNNLNFFRTWKH